MRVSPLESASGDPVGEGLIKDWLQRSLERVPDIGKSAHRLVRVFRVAQAFLPTSDRALEIILNRRG
eukprot:1333015-Pleurochrysis_carterae.AAC.1